jgi:hypothetical protein
LGAGGTAERQARQCAQGGAACGAFEYRASIERGSPPVIIMHRLPPGINRSESLSKTSMIKQFICQLPEYDFGRLAKVPELGSSAVGRRASLLVPGSRALAR